MNLTTSEVLDIWLDCGMNELTQSELSYLTDYVNTRGQEFLEGKNPTQWVNEVARRIKDEVLESFTPHYMILVQYKGSAEISIMHTKKDGVWRNCVAEESNKHLLIEIAERLITENLIDSYQLVRTAGEPVLNNKNLATA
jgi:hypothetical protein